MLEPYVAQQNLIVKIIFLFWTFVILYAFDLDLEF